MPVKLPIDLDPLLRILKGLPWGQALIDLARLLSGLISAPSVGGLYEVLEYDSTLELLDPKGVRACFSKRQKVRYLQDHIIAYQDQAWGDGEFLLDYRCSPGVAVDRYRLGHKTLVLISLRDVRQRGDVDEFHIQWRIRRGFLSPQEQWETEISHPTRRLRLRVIFPRRRFPSKAWLVQADSQRSMPLAGQAGGALPDGRWQVAWETEQPRLYERYILRWSW
jgi:hypothetical protein